MSYTWNYNVICQLQLKKQTSSSVTFDSCTYLWNHHHNLDVEHFHHFPKTPCFSVQLRAASDLFFFSVVGVTLSLFVTADLFALSGKWNPTVWTLLYLASSSEHNDSSCIYVVDLPFCRRVAIRHIYPSTHLLTYIWVSSLGLLWMKLR